ncbi:MAG: multicopper oxidase domain-containing protein [Solirubrobacteraceae bacterium]
MKAWAWKVAIALIAMVGSSTLATALPLSAGGRDPYTQVVATDVNPDAGVFETTLTADEATVDVGLNRSAHVQAYNGSVPGPTLKLKVGDEVIIHFVNNLAHPTGIHWHGIELPNGMDGTTFTQNLVAPGETFLYKFRVTRPGIYWYHPHHHSSTNQVFKGLYGMIIVEDPNDDALQASGTLPTDAQTEQVVLSDATVCKAPGANDATTYDTTAPTDPWIGGANLPDQPGPNPAALCDTSPIDEDGNATADYVSGDIPAIQKNNGGPESEGQTVLTNGKYVGPRAGSPTAPGAVDADADRMNVRPGQGLRLQLVNAATTRYMRLRLTTAAGATVNLVRVGGEGGLLNNAVLDGGVQGGFDTKYSTGEVLLPPGSRADVVAAIPAAPTTGVLTLWTEDYERVGQAPFFSKIPSVPVMHLNLAGSVVNPAYTIAAGAPLRAATGDPVAVLPAATALLRNPAGFTAGAKPGMSAQNIVLGNNGANTQVDGVIGTHDVPDYQTAAHLGSTRYARLGDVLQLQTTNSTSARHPFHLHGFSMQPLTLTKAANPTYTFPTEFRDNIDIPPGYTLTFRLKIEDRPMPDGVTPGGALGRWVFHCHIFFHATLGMLSELVILPAGQITGTERPDINVNGTEVQVNQGATASITGSAFDGDNEALTLSSSDGTVTKTTGDNFSWSLPTGTGSSRYVYLNATDASGSKAQIPFHLTIVNTGTPALGLPAAQSLVQGTPVSFDVTATDADAVDALALGASGLPAGLTFKDNGNRTGTVSGTPSGPPGDATATFTAADGHHTTVSQPLGFSVAPPAFSPLVRSPLRMVGGKVTLGCSFPIPTLSACAATVTRSGSQAGQAAAAAKAGAASGNVTVPLDAKTRTRVNRSLPGVPVSVGLVATRADTSAQFPATVPTRIVAAKLVVGFKFDQFARRGTTLTKRARTALTKAGKSVGSAVKVTCTGHPDRGSSSKRVARARAVAACSALKKAGLKAKFTVVASTKTKRRRVELTIRR